jgi:sulfhydrogenase subunit delta
MTRRKAKLAVFKFASCDGCQLSLLDAEDELLAVCDKVEIAHFAEASSDLQMGPYDVTLVEGSITTNEDAERIRQVRAQSTFLMTIGACATAGGIQALRNTNNVRDWVQSVYPTPEFIHTLATSTPIAAHVMVDFELRGCPVNYHQLVEVIVSIAEGHSPRVPSHSVCMDCKLRGTVCTVVARGTPCLGPVTQSGCGAICPAYDRGCYGCFGPSKPANTSSLMAQFRHIGKDPEQLIPLLSSFNVAANEFKHAVDGLRQFQ